MRSGIRSASLSVVGTLVDFAPSRLLSAPRTHFLYFHSLPASAERSFRELLAYLSRFGEFVSYSEAVQSARAGLADKTRFCVSVDDAFASCRRTATIAEDFGFRACFFVPTALVGAGSRSEVSSFFRSHQHIEDAALSWDDISNLRSRGHEIGSHTINHPDLARVSEEQLAHEVFESKRILEGAVGPVSHFAWPFGTSRHKHPSLQQLAMDAGYESVASAIRGAHSSPLDTNTTAILREHCAPEWPLRHNLAFVARSAFRSS